MSLEIVPMQHSDLEEVKALEDILFPVDAWTIDMFREELEQVGTSRDVMIAKLDGRIVGYVSFRYVGHEGDVNTIAVDTSVQQQGVGTAMMNWLEETARSRKVRELFLEVRSDNIPAVAMYLARDFERIDLRRNYYEAGVDAYVMRKRL